MTNTEKLATLSKSVEFADLSKEAQSVIVDLTVGELNGTPEENHKIVLEKYGQKVLDEIKAWAVSGKDTRLNSSWCNCEESEFLCYPEDGECSCGMYKHHVHCKKCGGVSQVG